MLDTIHNCYNMLSEYSLIFQIFIFTLTLVVGYYAWYKEEPDCFDYRKKPVNLLLTMVLIIGSLSITLVWFVALLFFAFTLITIPIIYALKHICLYLDSRFK